MTILLSNSLRPGWLWLAIWLATLAAGRAQTAEFFSAEVLTNAVQVRSLTPQAAARHLPVRLRGVCLGQTSAVEKWAAVIMDQAEGIYLEGPLSWVGQFDRGDDILVEGLTDPGDFAPFVKARTVRKIGTAQIPPPLRVDFGDLSDGRFDAQWVEVAGVVRNCEPTVESGRPNPSPGTVLASTTAAPGSERTFTMTLAEGNNRLSVRVDGEIATENYVDAKVRLRGICFSQHNSSRQLMNPLLVVPRGVDLTIEQPSFGNPFNLPIQPVSGLMEFDRHGHFGHRVHVRGVVTYALPGEGLWLRDLNRGLRVESTQSQGLQIGDQIDVAGFPDRSTYSPVLKDAIYRKVATLAPPQPVPLANWRVTMNHDDDLVELEADLWERRFVRDGCIVTLEWKGMRLEAALRTGANDRKMAHWLPVSRVRVVGICSVLPAKDGPVAGMVEPQSFQILLRGPEDLTVIAPPSWWTYQHILLLLGFVTGGALLALAAVMWVARQRLREQANHRATADAEFAAILSERNRVAREIHDTLAQGLVATSVQLRLAKRQCATHDHGAAQYVDAAQQMVRETLDEARNSIWNMRAHVLENTDLAGALEGILKQLSEGSGVQTTLEVAGESRRLAPVIENNLLRIGQEAITNATKHAKASHIVVKLEFAGKQFHLTVRDDGQGFDPTAPSPANSGFGLVGIRERAAQMKGALHIQSARGQGTEIHLSLALFSE